MKFILQIYKTLQNAGSHFSVKFAFKGISYTINGGSHFFEINMITSQDYFAMSHICNGHINTLNFPEAILDIHLAVIAIHSCHFYLYLMHRCVF